VISAFGVVHKGMPPKKLKALGGVIGGGSPLIGYGRVARKPFDPDPLTKDPFNREVRRLARQKRAVEALKLPRKR